MVKIARKLKCPISSDATGTLTSACSRVAGTRANAAVARAAASPACGHAAPAAPRVLAATAIQEKFPPPWAFTDLDQTIPQPYCVF